MTSKIDRFMVNLGFSQTDVRKVRHRNTLYVGIVLMGTLAALGLALNLGV